MYDRVRIALKLSTCALVFAGYMALASVREYGGGLLIIPCILCLGMPVGERLDRRSALYRIFTKAVSILYFCFIPLSIIALGLLDGVIALVIYIQAHTIMHHKTAKSYYHIFLMAFFMLLAACPQSPEPIIGLVMPFFLVSAIWAFLTLRIYTELAENAGKSIPAVVTSEKGVSSLNIAAFENPFNVGLVFAITAISAAAILLSMGVFLFTPRIEAGFLGRGDINIRSTGLNHTVDLRGGTQVQEDTTAVMRVAFPDEPGNRFESGLMYWRSTTLSQFNRSQWSHRELRGSYDPIVPALYMPGRMGAAHEIRRRQRPGMRRVRQAIYIDDAPEQGLPCLDLAQMVTVPDNLPGVAIEWGSGMDFTVMLYKTGARRLNYTVWSDILSPTPEQLRAAPDDYAEQMRERDYALLTHHELLPETQEIVRSITEGRQTVYDKAMAIQQWLGSEQFSYTLDLPSLGSQAAIDVFLTRTRRGHCELFASAMALMLRSLGVPARVVSGFRGGEWNALDQSYTVRANMAHLWVEVLFLEHGWVIFDPSPRGEDTVTGMRRLSNLISLLTLRSKMLWYQRVVGFDRNLQWAWLRNMSVGLFSPISGLDMPESARKGFRLPPLRILIAALLGAGALTAFVLLRRTAARSVSRAGLSPDQQRAVRLFFRVRKKLEQAGIACEAMTAEEMGNSLRASQWESPETMLETLRQYNEARFGHRAFPQNAYAAAKKRLREVRFTGN